MQQSNHGSKYRPGFRRIYHSGVNIWENILVPAQNCRKISGRSEMQDQIKGFIKELKPFSLDEISDDTLHEFLTLHHLNVEDFSEQYSEEYYHKTR